MLCSGSDAKFRQHLPAVLLIHVSAINREDVYPENNREALTNFCIGSGAEHIGKRTQSTNLGGIRTYLYLLASRLHGRNKSDKVDQLMNTYMVNYIYIYICCVSSSSESQDE